MEVINSWTVQQAYNVCKAHYRSCFLTIYTAQLPAGLHCRQLTTSLLPVYPRWCRTQAAAAAPPVDLQNPTPATVAASQHSATPLTAAVPVGAAAPPVPSPATGIPVLKKEHVTALGLKVSEAPEHTLHGVCVNLQDLTDDPRSVNKLPYLLAELISVLVHTVFIWALPCPLLIAVFAFQWYYQVSQGKLPCSCDRAASWQCVVRRTEKDNVASMTNCRTLSVNNQQVASTNDNTVSSPFVFVTACCWSLLLTTSCLCLHHTARSPLPSSLN